MIPTKQIILPGLLSWAVSGQQAPSTDTTQNPNGQYINLASTPPLGASAPIGPAFVSFSVEWASFPEYAGNLSHPNIFSDNLLGNIGALQGVRPYIRVGGATQDYGLLDAYLKTAFNFTKKPEERVPGVIEYGQPYFESFQTFPNTKFIYGFNLAKNSEGYRRNLFGGVTVACNALQGGKLLYWELGNEPDRYALVSQPNAGNIRPKSWNEASYANEWLSVTRDLKTNMGYTCKEMVTDKAFKFIAPSFAGTAGLDPWEAYEAGIDKDKIVAEFSSHSYMATTPSDPSISIPNTLMNHAAIVKTLTPQIQLAAKVHPSLPFALTQTDSIPAPGKQSVTDVFGAALWALDFDLYAASNNISRVHAHQTTNSLSSSWQPVRSTKFVNGPQTLPQYYGHVAAAAMVGPSAQHPTRIVNLPTGCDQLAMYAAYVHDQLARVMVINMTPSSSALKGASKRATRGVSAYYFKAPQACQGTAPISRLIAAGHDATSGVSWDGLSYEANLGQGRPAAAAGASKGEKIAVGPSGSFRIDLGDSSAAMVTLNCAAGKA